MTALNLFGLALMNVSRRNAVDHLLSAGTKTTAHFVNAHCVNIAAKDTDYRAALDGADALLPDGSGMALAAKISGQRMTENLNGTDLFPVLCAEAARQSKSLFLLGAEPGVAEAAAATACRHIPDLRIAGTQHGYLEAGKTEHVIDRINASGADIVLVAMGVPVQELWVQEHRDALEATLVMGVGAMFDFHANRVSRAPKVLRRMGCEWMWRLAIEPRRMAKRYLLGNPEFVVRAVANSTAQMWAKVDTTAIAKRSVDILGAGAAIAGLLPVFLMTAAAIRLESSGPVFYRQTRVGKDGTPFSMLKFRSMYRDAEARRAALLASSDRNGICFKSRSDPRITRVGRIIRRLSIDELPQLLNVLRGEMSMVGPRPALPEEVAAYPEIALGRLAVKPGITGLWQIAGRADIGFDKMIDMDLAYVRSRSILLDLVILALTGRAVVSGRGAY